MHETLLMSRILVVDDDTLVLSTARILLIHAGHEVVAIDQGRMAVLALERESFDLVLVDVFMPGMDGYQVIQEFRRIDPGIPIVAMSGVMFRESSAGRLPDFLGMAGKMGATRTLHKPFKSAELLEAVQACMDVRAQQSQARQKSA